MLHIHTCPYEVAMVTTAILKSVSTHINIINTVNIHTYIYTHAGTVVDNGQK